MKTTTTTGAYQDRGTYEMQNILMLSGDDKHLKEKENQRKRLNHFVS